VVIGRFASAVRCAMWASVAVVLLVCSAAAQEGENPFENIQPLDATQAEQPAAALPWSDEPVPDATDAEIVTGTWVRNRPDSGGEVNYTLAGRSFTMGPGQMQRLPSSRDWVIEFLAGGEGSKRLRYKLTDGVYEFRATDDGWGLLKIPIKITLDNSANDAAFYYVVDTERFSVEAGKTREHTSKLPMLMLFDAGGADEQTVAKLLSVSGAYKIDVNAQQQRWDLYPAAAESAAP